MTSLSDEYLASLKEQGFEFNPHNMLTAIDPPHSPNRRWRCGYCGAVDLYDNLLQVHCSYEYPPCTSGGKTPECAPDCRALADALTDGQSVHTIGFTLGRKDS